MAKITGGRFIAEFLNAQGVTAFFFVPTMLSRALAEMDNMPIKRVLTHGEKAAAYMADGYARASGRPGICAAQAVGAANLAAGLRDAYMGHSPVIALTGGRWGHQKHKINYQEMDDFPIFSQVTKANFQVDSVGRLPDLLRQAFREATSGTPAPVNLLFAGKEGDIEHEVADLKVIAEETSAQVPAYRPAPEAARVAEAARILKKAKRPVIVVGGGARLSGAGPEVLKLAKTLSIPVATSLNAMSLVSENNPLYIGVPGTYSRSCTNKILMRADLVLYIGSQTAGQVTHFWKIPPAGTPVIQIGIDPADLGRNYPNAVSLLGDAKVALKALNEAVGGAGKTPRNAKWVEETSAAVKEWRAEVKPLRDSDAEPMRPERIMKELGDWLPRDTIVVCDTGHAGMWSAQQLWVSEAVGFYSRRRIAGLGFPRVPGRESRDAEKTGGLLHGRRRLLVSLAGTGNRGALRNSHGDGRQQQQLPESGNHNFPPRLRRKTVEEAGRDVAFLENQLRHDCGKHGRAGNSRHKTRRVALRPGPRHFERPPRGGRSDERHRSAGAQRVGRVGARYSKPLLEKL